MKTIFLGLFVILFLTKSLPAQWEIINQGLPGVPQDVDFVGNSGWVTADLFLYKSNDAGISWEKVEQEKNMHLYKIDFVSDLTGWACGFSDDINKNTIYKTNNGGKSWDIKYEFNSRYVVDLYAIGADSLFVMGSSFIYRTMDDGKNWDSVFVKTDQVNLATMDFANMNCGVALGTSYSSEMKGIIFKTSDGGENWQEVTETKINSLFNVRFVKDSTAFFTAQNDSGQTLFCKTDDFFKTWKVQAKKELPFETYFPVSPDTIFAVSYVSDNVSIVASLDVSYNAGADWTTIKELPFWGFNYVGFTGNSGLLIGSVGGAGFISESYGIFVMRSLDMGRSWQFNILSYPFRDIYFFNKNKGIIVGGAHAIHLQTGEIFKTDDAGKRLKLIQSTGSLMRSVQFINDDIGYCLKELPGILYKTVDGGNNWYQVYENNYDSTGISIQALDLQFTDPDEGWIAGRYWDSEGQYACVMHTGNGGKDWEVVWNTPASEKNYSLNDIYLFDNRSGWAVGDNGLIAKLSAGTWQAITNITDISLNKVFFSDKNNGWISAGFFDPWSGNPLLMKTNNCGETWEEIKNFNYIIDDIYFINNSTGWIVGADTLNNGIILFTKDAGKNWNILVDNLPGALHAIHFKDGWGWAVGERGLVLTTKDGINWINKKPIPVNSFSLYQNHPNPFNNSTTINYRLAVGSYVELSIFNILGQKVKTLFNGRKAAGFHSIEWDATNFSSGLYYYQLKTDTGMLASKKLLLIK